jgi:hypothetical protein
VRGAHGQAEGIVASLRAQGYNVERVRISYEMTTETGVEDALADQHG